MRKNRGPVAELVEVRGESLTRKGHVSQDEAQQHGRAQDRQKRGVASDSAEWGSGFRRRDGSGGDGHGRKISWGDRLNNV